MPEDKLSGIEITNNISDTGAVETVDYGKADQIIPEKLEQTTQGSDTALDKTVDVEKAYLAGDTAQNAEIGGAALATGYADAAKQARDRESPTFKGYEASAEGPETAAGEDFITAETTIAGNLEKYLDPDSALNRMAVARQREKAQALGASMSSMEVGATQAALYQQAGEFAAKDQEHASQAKLQEQAAENKKTQILQEAQVAGDLNVQTAQIRDEQQKIENAWEATMTGLNAETQKEMTILKENFETARQNSMNELQVTLQDGQINADLSIMIMNNANQKLNNWQLMVQELTQDEEWMAMMGNGANKFFNDQLRTVTSGIAFDAAAVGLSEEYSSYIKDLWDANVFWKGRK